jgi:CHAT domain-containing protein/Flp pilus assembly protein TadD
MPRRQQIARGGLALILLGGCAWRSAGSPDLAYREADRLLRRGELKAALTQAESGIRAEPSWRFRLLKAQILLTGGDAVEGSRYLASLSAPADAEIHARWRMLQAQADYMQSDFLAAETALTESESLAHLLRLPLLDAEIEMRRATLTLRRGEPEQADPMFRQVLDIAGAHGDSYLAANAMGNLGVMYMNASRCDQGIYWLDRAREEFTRLGSEVLYAKTIGNLAVCYAHLGDYDKAISYYEEAERGSRKAGNQRDLQTWLGGIATAQLEQGNYAQAVEGFRPALAIALQSGDKESAGWWLNNLTSASINLGNLDAADQYSRQAAGLGVSSWTDYYRRLTEAQIAAARHELDRAEKLFSALLTRPSQDPAAILGAETGLADVLMQLGRADAADAEFRKALALIERQRSQLIREEYKLSYLASLIETYQKYVDYLVTRNRIAQALEVAESSRARLLDEKLNAGGRAGRGASAPALEQLARSSKCLLLSYWLGPRRSFLWAVGPDGVELYVLPPERKIAPLVEAYRSFIEGLRDPLDSEFPAGRQLSEMLLGPVRGALGAGAHVLVIPDRALNSLNFETLPDPEDASRYLIDRVTVSVAPSLGLVASGARGAVESAPSILLIGNPESAVEEYPRLPHAAREIALIKQSLSNSRHVVFEGAEARPAAYRESMPAGFTWIHFAAHASANRESPLDSALILSRDPSHDNAGYTLSARDVMDVPLNAALVTLSACRSAGAKTYSGEGLVGLSWAFLRAGAHSVVAGLWDVTDLSTANLMADFYGELAKNVPPADALRAAKLNLIHSHGAYRKPFYWGPFQLYVGAGL